MPQNTIITLDGVHWTKIGSKVNVWISFNVRFHFHLTSFWECFIFFGKWGSCYAFCGWLGTLLWFLRDLNLGRTLFGVRKLIFWSTIWILKMKFKKMKVFLFCGRLDTKFEDILVSINIWRVLNVNL